MLILTVRHFKTYVTITDGVLFLHGIIAYLRFHRYDDGHRLRGLRGQVTLCKMVKTVFHFQKLQSSVKKYKTTTETYLNLKQNNKNKRVPKREA